MAVAASRDKRRKIVTGRDDETAGELERLFRQKAEIEVRIAKSCVRLVEVRHVEDEGHATLAEFCERMGYCSGPAAWTYLKAGWAMERRPELEAFLRHGSTTIDHLAAFHAILEKDGAVRPDDQWFRWLTDRTCREFRRLVRERLAEMRGELVPRTLYMTEAGSRELDKTLAHLSGRLKREVSGGEAVEVACREYNERHVVVDQPEGTRRKGDTAGDPSRYVPVEVLRQLWRKHGMRCVALWCDHWKWLQIMHVVWHAAGGSRELENLKPGCPKHHSMVDQGLIELVIENGELVAIRNQYGVDIGRPRDPPPGYEYLVG